MYCKIKITCKLCNCSTEIEADNFHAPGRIICQNCGQVMPNGIYDTLAAAMDSLARLKEDTCEEGFGDEIRQGFLLSVSGKPDAISSDQQYDLD